jgi:hypothetical protein
MRIWIAVLVALIVEGGLAFDAQAGKSAPNPAHEAGALPQSQGKGAKGKPDGGHAEQKASEASPAAALVEAHDGGAAEGADVEQERELLKQKYGDALLFNPTIRFELKVHAWRMARLKQIRVVAAPRSDSKLNERIDGLIAREEQRHKSRMEDFQVREQQLAKVRGAKP